jgi:hypothetical protein
MARGPQKKVERLQSPDNVRTLRGAEAAVRRGRRSGCWQKIVEPLQTLRSVSRRSNAQPLRVRETQAASRDCARR